MRPPCASGRLIQGHFGGKRLSLDMYNVVLVVHKDGVKLLRMAALASLLCVHVSRCHAFADDQQIGIMHNYACT